MPPLHPFNQMMYLNTAAMTLLSSSAGLQSAKNGLLPWKKSLKPEADALLKELSSCDTNSLHRAITCEAAQQLQQVAEGIRRFEQQSYNRIPSSSTCLLKEGTTQLLDYGGHGKPLLCIPSLINRAYIFDLSPERSMVQYLKQQGFQPLVLDWNQPGDAEQDFGLDDYINRIHQALDVISEPVTLIGYCMGGMMAMAATLHQPKKLNGLVLLATPWDFHSKDLAWLLDNQIMLESFKTMLKANPVISGELIYQIMFMMQPCSVYRKYARFATMDLNQNDTSSFIEREHWLHDSVNMVSNVAYTCFIDWARHNTPMQGKWLVQSNPVDPSAIAIPTFIACAQKDKVVPPTCAGILSQKIQGAMTIHPNTGHIGMIAGTKAQENLWNPLAKWLSNL